MMCGPGHRERSEAKADARNSEAALRQAVGKNQVYARKVFYALNRWHASWQLMDAFQRWVAAMRLRRVRPVGVQAAELQSKLQLSTMLPVAIFGQPCLNTCVQVTCCSCFGGELHAVA